MAEFRRLEHDALQLRHTLELPAPLDTALLLIAASEALKAHMKRCAAGLGLGIQELDVLLAVDDGPWIQSDLSARTGMDVGNLSRTVRRLEQHGLVTRTADASDGRLRHVVLTPDGERLHEEFAARVANDLPVISRLGARDVGALRDLLARGLGDPPSP